MLPFRLLHGDDFDGVDLGIISLGGKFNVKLAICDFHRHGLHISLGESSRFGPDIKVFENFPIDIEGENPFARASDAVIGLAEMQFHLIFSIRKFLGERIHRIVFRVIYFRLRGVRNLLVRTLNHIATGKTCIAEPLDFGCIFDGSGSGVDPDGSGKSIGYNRCC